MASDRKEVSDMSNHKEHGQWLQINHTYLGDSRELMNQVEPESISLSLWSPPYFVGKSYETNLTYTDWTNLLQGVVNNHSRILKPGAFMAINIADILAFADPAMPKFQADLVSSKRSPVTREMVLDLRKARPELNRYQMAEILGCSEQTIQRRLDHNNVRGGKHSVQTRVKPVMGLLEDIASNAGLFFYDRRVWVKDPAWQNSRWHSGSYRAVDEFEYILIFWKPGITKIDRRRLGREEWAEWGSRGVWKFPSVRSNKDHEAKFPVQLPERLIRLFTDKNDVVLDPFMGSGTTGIAALRNERNYIGIELLPGYAELANKNCDLEAQKIEFTRSKLV